MGYELRFHFQEEIERGKYNEEETQTKAVKVGSPYEDVPLEAAAAKIFAQLARRNILVTDVEIYEFTKKKLSYREAEDGIRIKNKKFRFDDGPVLISEDTEGSIEPEETTESQLTKEPALVTQLVELIAQLKQGNNPPLKTAGAAETQPRPVNLGRPLREEVFDPPPFLRDEVKKRGMPFTRGKTYPIYDEKPSPNAQMGMDYVTVDDMGQKRTIASIHFNPPTKLDGPFEAQGPPAGEEPNLAWDGAEDNINVPDLRG